MPLRYVCSYWVALVLAVAAELVSASPAHADPGGVFSLVSENDAYVKDDRYYTNGLKVGYLRAAGTSDPISNWVQQNIWPGATEAPLRASFSLGQSMFTPQTLSFSTPQPNDHPYAGWLYLGYGLTDERPSSTTTAELEVGVVGPSAGAKWLQDQFHGFLQEHEPQGWGTQIEDQFGIDLTVMRQWRRPNPLELDGINVHFLPHLGATVGSVMDEAFAGASIVIGNEHANGSLPLRVRPGLGGNGGFDDTSGFGWYLFAGFSARAVGYNVFLDGPTPYNSNVHSKPFVLDAQAGVALRVWRAQITFTFVDRSKEFSQQRGDQRFGVATVSWHL